MGKEGFGLRAKFEALRAAILSYVAMGVPDSDRRLVQARQQQRLIAEEMVRRGLAKGIAFDREGDLKRGQCRLARLFQVRPQENLDAEEGRLDAGEEKPPAQVIQLKSLHIRGENGAIAAPTLAPSTIVGLQALRLEGKVGSFLQRDLSVLEGSMGVDYVIDKDPDSEVTFYVPIGGSNG